MQTKLFDIKDWCQHGFDIENYPYIGTINGDVDIHKVIEIGGRHYIPGAINLTKGTAGVRHANVNTRSDSNEYEDYITCPYCGYADGDSFEQSEDNDTIECGRCGATIEYTRDVIVSYSTKGIKPPKIVKRAFVVEEA